jgi:heme-degrading monooxygenase HmoA
MARCRTLNTLWRLSMYGTVARIQATPGTEEDLIKLSREDAASSSHGYRFHHLYKLDAGENDYLLVVGFDTREAYRANAESPEQHAFYEQFRSFLTADPEWMDGEIIDSRSA